MSSIQSKQRMKFGRAAVGVKVEGKLEVEVEVEAVRKECQE